MGNVTNHAIVQNMLHDLDRKMVSPACCVPTELKPLTMLYKDDNGHIVLKSYNEMIVEGCGCN